jgi:hypothetical protein
MRSGGTVSTAAPMARYVDPQTVQTTARANHANHPALVESATERPLIGQILT